jgi:cation diffusion facilitator CzcD-associated flavoprotein CzcO
MVHDPETANELIPDDHLYSEKRPPFVTGYYEVYNRPNVSLVSLRKTPILRVTETGIETSDGLREFDIIVWATGFDFGTGALMRMGIRGRDDLSLEEHWKDGPSTYLGVQTAGFPNLFFAGGPHTATGNIPRVTSDQVDFVTDLVGYARGHDYAVIEPLPTAEGRWTRAMDEKAAWSPFAPAVSYFFGSNIPGKPKKYLLNALGRLKTLEIMHSERDGGYKSFEFSPSPAHASVDV